MKNCRMRTTVLITLLMLAMTYSLGVDAQSCQPSGEMKGIQPPQGQCNTENDSECCEPGKSYPTYECSPQVVSQTKATLTLNSFQRGGDGGGPPECDNQYHDDNTSVVALLTGWYKGGSRCLKDVIISAYRRSVKAMVVDECDSTMGCDVMNTVFDAHRASHFYQLVFEIM